MIIDYTYFDIISILIIFISLLIAYLKGVTHELFAILNWVLSGFLAFSFGSEISPALNNIPIIKDIIFDNCELEILISIGLCFIICLIIISMITPIFSKTIQKSSLKSLDSSLGVLFGIIRGVLIVCIILLIHNTLLDKSSYLESVSSSRATIIFSDILTALEQLTPEDFQYWLQNRYSQMTSLCNN